MSRVQNVEDAGNPSISFMCILYLFLVKYWVCGSSTNQVWLGKLRVFIKCYMSTEDVTIVGL